MEPLSITAFPLELTLKVIEDLDDSNLARAKCVCRLWKKLVEDIEHSRWNALYFNHFPKATYLPSAEDSAFLKVNLEKPFKDDLVEIDDHTLIIHHEKKLTLKSSTLWYEKARVYSLVIIAIAQVMKEKGDYYTFTGNINLVILDREKGTILQTIPLVKEKPLPEYGLVQVRSFAAIFGKIYILFEDDSILLLDFTP